MNACEKTKLLCEISTKLMETQLAQIKIYKTGDEDLARIATLCVEIAVDLFEKCKYEVENNLDE